jgi:hypothetical protein
VQKRLELCFQDLNNGLFPPEDEQDDEDADCKQSKLDSGIAVFEALFRGSDHFADKDATTQYMSTSSQPPSRGDIRDSLLSLASLRPLVATFSATSSEKVNDANVIWIEGTMSSD